MVPPEYLALIGVAVGATISILGNLLTAKRQALLQIQAAVFARKLEMYIKLMELLWPMGIMANRSGVPRDRTVPIPYDTNANLAEWVNRLSPFVAANQLLLDEKTRDACGELNQRVTADLRRISDSSTAETRDARTREVGLESAGEIFAICQKVHNSGWRYFRKAYKVKL